MFFDFTLRPVHVHEHVYVHVHEGTLLLNGFIFLVPKLLLLGNAPRLVQSADRPARALRGYKPEVVWKKAE